MEKRFVISNVPIKLSKGLKLKKLTKSWNDELSGVFRTLSKIYDGELLRISGF